VPKYTFTEIDNVNSPSAASTINANFQELQDLIDLLLSRDGTLPNTMSADLDLNGFRLLNAQNVALEGSGGDMLAATYDPSGIAAQVVGLSAVQTLTNKTIDPSLNTIDGDKLDIDFTPSNYTPDASPAEASDVDDLAAHLKGIDTALTSSGDMSTATYDPAGIAEQLVGTTASQTLTNKDINPALNGIDGDKLDIDFTPSNYTPDDSAAEADDVDDLAAHLKGIDAALAVSGLDLSTYDPAGIGEQLVGLTAAQTLTNKTINPSLNGIDGDKLDIDFTPTNYTPDMPAEADDLDDLAAHLKGIDDSFADLVTTSELDDAIAGVDTSFSVTKSTVRVNPTVTASATTIDDTFLASDITYSADVITRIERIVGMIDTGDTSASFTANLSFGSTAGGEVIVVVVPDDLTGTVTIQSSDSGTGGLVDGAASITMPASGYFTVERLSGSTKNYKTSLISTPVFTGLATFNAGISMPFATTTSGTLTMAAHSGKTVPINGNTTVPVTDGFSCRIISTGSHDIDAGGTAVSLTSGQSIVVFTDGTTVYRSAVETLATMPTS
jgi:hypothetical protein